MADNHALRNLWVELENGDPIEHHRPKRDQKPWREKLVVPQCVTRVYRGFWGDLRTVQPLLGDHTSDDYKLGTIETSYTPIRYRMDVAPRMRKQHWADAWNIYPNHATYHSTPPLKGRRPDKGIWCMLLMYVFETEEHRPSFWVNPLDPAWDVEERGEMSFGQTFYVNHQPIPATAAFVRIDKLTGTMRHRSEDAKDALVSLLNDLTPPDEWRPPPREEKPPPPKRCKFPQRYLRESHA